MLTKESGLNNNRNYGIELLRIIAGFYVIMLHTLGQGGVLENLLEGTLSFKIVWLIEIISYCAVDVFILISGYTSISNIEKEHDWSKLILLWMEVLYYSVIVYIVFSLIKGSSIKSGVLLSYFFPIMNHSEYWFFASYLCLMMLKPVLDKGIRYTNEKTLKILFILLILIVSIYTIVVDRFFLILGQSPYWFVVLYAIGAIIKKCEFDKKISNLKLVCLCASFIFLTWACKCYGPVFYIFNHRIYDRTLISSYTSPTILGCAIIYIIAFSRLKFPDTINKIIRFASPSVFAIYLINTHPLYWNFELKNKFIDFGPRRISVLLPKILLYCVSFFLFAIFIDKIRQYIFQKLQIRNKIYKLLYTHK